MKKTITALVAFLFLAFALSGCTQSVQPQEGTFSVVATIFPQYDWVRQIAGDHVDHIDLTLLLNSRIDLHNYQPSVDDIVRIATCDLFIYVGGASDSWVENALRQAANPDMIVLNLLDVLGDGAKTEEIIEGMEDDDHDDDHDDGAEEHEGEYDEHVWLSLKNAQLFCSAIADALSEMDAANAEAYQSNLAAYVTKLSDLDSEYRSVINAAPVKTLLFGDRFPFRYLVDEYEISYYAAFSGCSAETEAGFDTILFLAEKMDDLGLRTIMVTESSDRRIAETIRSNTVAQNHTILALDSLQSVASDDIQDGATYLSMMESNLGVLKQALR